MTAAFSLTSDGHTPRSQAVGEGCGPQPFVGAVITGRTLDSAISGLLQPPTPVMFWGLGLPPLLLSSQALHPNWCQQVRFIPHMNLVASCSAIEKSSLALVILPSKASENPK